MSILSRLHKIANALGGSTKAYIGFTLGIPPAAFKDDEYDSFIGDLFNYNVKQAQNVLGSFFGPTGSATQIVGAIPEPVRSPVRTVTAPITTGLETAYREGISEPITTLFTVGSIGASQGDQFAFADPDTWRDSYRIAQSRSPGQALAVAMGRVDIYDEAEMAEFAGTDFYKIMSGTTDGLLRVFADPTVIGGKALHAIRQSKAVKGIYEVTDITAARQAPQVNNFKLDIWDTVQKNGENAPAIIRDRYFPDHDAGAQIASVLGTARSPQELSFAMDVLMGDRASLDQLRDIRSKLYEPIKSLRKTAAELGPIDGMNPSPQDLSTINTELKLYYDKHDLHLQRIEQAAATLRQIPRTRLISSVPAIGEIRTAVTHSDFYQNSSLGRTLQVFSHHVAHPIANLSDQRSDIQIHRQMIEAGLPQDIRDSFRSRYMTAADDNAREAVALEAERAGLRQIAQDARMSETEFEELLVKVQQGKSEAHAMLAKRVLDDRGASSLSYLDEKGDFVTQVFPPWITQESRLLPLVNMRELRSAATRIGQFRLRHPGIDVPIEFMNQFNRVWKPAVLLRPAWTFRVVGDEQLRIAAKIGALSQIDNLLTGARDYSSDFRSAISEHGISNVAGRRNRPLRQGFGVRGFEYKGNEMEGVFGTPDDIRRDWRDRASAARSWGALIGDREDAILRQARESAENFKSVTPDHPTYAATYNWAIERLRSHPISNRLLQGEDPEDVLNWLTTTPEGTDILRANSIPATNPRNWVDEMTREVDKYTVNNDELRSLIASGKGSYDDLVRLVPDQSLQPVAHGEVLNQVQNRGFISGLLSATVEKFFDKLGRLPTDTFSRNPFMGHMYRAEVKRQIDLLGNKPIDTRLKNQIEERARNYALNETQKLLYDLAEQSRLGEMLGVISPFYNAWEEVLTRWTGLAIENPVFAARARLVWRSPEAMGLVTDEDGRVVKPGETYSDDPVAPNYRGKERMITIPLPSFMHGLPGSRAIAGREAVAFNKKSFNMVLAGFPSAGPLVQLAVNEVVKDRPEWAESVKFILPFGPTYRTTDIIFPASAKRFLSVAEEDEKFANTRLRIAFDLMTDIQLGKRAPMTRDELWAESGRRAREFTMMRGFAAMFLPAAPTFLSPYQTQINAFRQAQARYAQDENSLADEHGNPRTPEEWFLDTHGEEYFALTQAVTRSMDGIPPTLESWLARKEHRKLIEEFPELGGLIIGDQAGEFNSAVYQAQLHQSLGPGTGEKQREPIPFNEAVEDPQRRLAWIEYRRVMDLIESTRIQRGLPNLQVAAAQDLALIKAAFTEQLGNKYPAWKEDFNQTDKGKWEKKIAALRTISSQPEMQGREDMKGIQRYLKARDEMTALLKQRKESGGASTLNASSNQDLKEIWNAYTGYLIEQNLPFSAVFYRHLENDPLGLD